MQKSMPIAVVAGALIIAAALVFHARQLTQMSDRLAALENRTGALDARLTTFSDELPAMIGQAGKDAGRQAVQGIIEETIQKPLGWLRPGLTRAASNAVEQAGGRFRLGELLPPGEIPLIRFDIPDPVVNIDILTNLKELPSLPWLNTGRTNPPAPSTATNRPAPPAGTGGNP